MNDLNEMLVKGAIDGLKDIAKDILKSAAEIGRKELTKLLVDFEMGFKGFLDRNYKRLFRVKTLLNPANPVPLGSTFVSPNLKFDDKVLSEDDFLSRLREEKFIVITGIGGSGKSVFLKHLFIRFYTEKLGRVPFFVELRNLKPETKLVDYMFSQLSAVSTKAIDKEIFHYALKAGKFAFLLDGFDEVDPSLRDSLAQQLLDLTYEYCDNALVLTSRPDGPFNSWTEFHIAQMEPFNKKQVLSLISKMRYDKTTKKEFSRLVRESLFKTHKEYLSNPLLATLMLLTFDQGAEIPTRMHTFFERAFDVLFYKHDATKETSFRRKFKTTLAIDDFRKIFATFSAFTYLDHGSSFTHSQAINCAGAALEYNESTEKADALIYDLCTSVSILIREGDNYNYIHRSMQEFFVAQFLAFRELQDWDAIVEQIVKDRPNDTVVRQLADINRDRFERQFLANRIAALRKDIDQIDAEKNPADLFLLFYITVSFRGNSIASWMIGRGDFTPKWYYMIRFIEQAMETEHRAVFQSFDWAKHFFSQGIPLKNEVSGALELETIVDASFLGTPMAEYLVQVKSTVIAMDDRLRLNTEKKKKLLSMALLKKEKMKSS